MNETQFVVFNSDDVIPGARPVCGYADRGEAIDHAADYVVRLGVPDRTEWVSPRFGVDRMLEAIIKSWSKNLDQFLDRRRREIMDALRQQEAA